MPANKGRGSNPKSHNNKHLGVVPKEITLFPEDWETAKAIGGTYSEGFRIMSQAFRRTYPDTMIAPRKLLVLLLKIKAKAEVSDEEIESAIADIESWGIEETYCEELAEGAIKVGNSYIV